MLFVGKGLRSAVATCLIIVSLAGTLPSATAYPREQNAGCVLTSINMLFANNFPQARRAEVIQGIQKWNPMKNQFGNTLWTNGQGSTHLAYWVDNPPGGSNATTVCGGSAFPQDTYFEFDDDLSGNDLVGTAAHEAGHAHGLKHSGKFDNNTAKPPYMATCCGWPDIYGQNLNYNTPSPRSGFWTPREVLFTVLPNSGWQFATTNDWLGAVNNQWQGADLKVQIAVWDANDNNVDFDNTRVRTQ